MPTNRSTNEPLNHENHVFSALQSMPGFVRASPERGGAVDGCNSRTAVAVVFVLPDLVRKCSSHQISQSLPAPLPMGGLHD